MRVRDEIASLRALLSRFALENAGCKLAMTEVVNPFYPSAPTRRNRVVVIGSGSPGSKTSSPYRI
jgi:hypothetical protein